MRGSESSIFVTTRWTQVLASRGDSEQARQALSDLCAAYYGPVLAFCRRESRDADEAREIAHEFFTGVLERQSLGGADPERGRFRSYLLGALKHFLSNRRAYQRREKRGGQVQHQPLTSPSGEQEGGLEMNLPEIAAPTQDQFFDREWALNLLDRALARLREEANQNDSLHQFELLKPWLSGENESASQAEIARQLGLSDGALRVAIHRLRRRFRDLVKAEISQTVHTPEEAAEELRHLIQSVS